MVEQEPQEIAEKKEEGRKRGGKSFPVLSFKETLVLAKGIVEHGTGKQMRRLTLFDKLKKSPTSGPSRQLITISSRYGLTTGSYAAEYLTITDEAGMILSASSSELERRQKSFQLAIQQQSVFNQLYERLKGKRLPASDVLRDELAQIGVPTGDRDTAAEVFIQNARDLGLIQEISGKDTIIPIEQVCEELPAEAVVPEPLTSPRKEAAPVPKVTPGLTVNINIQLTLPATDDESVYDRLFASLKRNLLP
jgi:hypothetical protein